MRRAIWMTAIRATTAMIPPMTDLDGLVAGLFTASMTGLVTVSVSDSVDVSVVACIIVSVDVSARVYNLG